MIDLPPTEALAAVLAAARAGSLTAAAAELSVTHGAISRRIQAVEGWLGAALFERHGRGVRLTPVGERFARSVERSFAAISSTAADIRTASRVGKVRLSTLPSVARLWIMPRLSRLQGEPADIAIALVGEHRVASLEAREADLAIRFGLGGWSGVDAHLMFRERLYPIAAPPVAARLAAEGPAALLGQTLLHDGDAGDWKAWFRSVGVAYKPRAGERKFEDYDLVLMAAEAGLGVALGRDPLAAPALRSGRLKRLPGPELASDRGHYLVTRTGETRPAVLTLARRIRALAAEESAG